MSKDKNVFLVAAAVVAACAVLAPQFAAGQSQDPGPAASSAEANFQTFHDRLAPYGRWVQHPRWGTVWHPTEVPADFRPYRDGHWENTPDYGTVWVSDYSADADKNGRWGDIVFHYGRWGYDPHEGWLWVPGYTWSPAWVAWRQGAGNIGWFPMPPGAYDGVGDYPDDWNGWYGYRDLYGATLTEAAFLSMWSFVPAYDIYAPEIGIDIIAPGGYGGFIGRTAGWTRFDRVNGHLANRAIDGGRFRAAFGRDLPRSGRNDFLTHRAAFMDLNRGRHGESMERGRMTPAIAHGREMGHEPSSYTRRQERGTMHSPYEAHTINHTYGHSAGALHENEMRGEYAHGYQHPENGRPDSASGRANYGYDRRPSDGNAMGERPNDGSGVQQHSNYGNGMQHPSGGFTQSPMNGGNAQRPQAPRNEPRHH